VFKSRPTEVDYSSSKQNILHSLDLNWNSIFDSFKSSLELELLSRHYC